MSKALALVVTQPMTLTDAMLIESSVAETDHPEWSSGGTYAKDARVIKAATHTVYQSAIDGNTGNDPAVVPSDGIAKWSVVGKTNRWLAFDDKVNTQTTSDTGAINYQIRPGRAVTSVNVLNVKNATTVRFRLVDPVYGTVYDKSANLRPIPVAPGWWQWFFGTRRGRTQHIATDLPSYPTADLFIEIQGGESLGVGVIQFGQQRRFGMGVTAGARVGINSYSVKTKDEWGNLTLKKRLSSKRIAFSMLIEKAEVDQIRDYFEEIDAVPCMFIASSQYESLSAFGIYNAFEALISYPSHSLCDIEIEELV